MERADRSRSDASAVRGRAARGSIAGAAQMGEGGWRRQEGAVTGATAGSPAVSRPVRPSGAQRSRRSIDVWRRETVRQVGTGGNRRTVKNCAFPRGTYEREEEGGGSGGGG